eukprot:gnl/TRDRNA2_/TRDRNA2_88105_c0_seq1.p1 gnl/TRDRNA2_/TRDRNA2_88105_c0~~gnl/TRDRNA2_/TRDRNA2_88105_c0_seq1.p1  ORF type:complete len:206 (-),score=39.95 gnl/TRDRNA2_/TRDRNA2_88105_c0_seq1:48-665(-)
MLLSSPPLVRCASAVLLVVLTCSGASSDEDDWRSFIFSMNQRVSPIHQDGSLRKMWQLRCKTLRHSKDYPDHIPRKQLDILCEKVLQEKSANTVVASEGSLPTGIFDPKYVPLLVGNVALVALIAWWIWTSSAPPASQAGAPSVAPAVVHAPVAPAPAPKVAPPTPTVMPTEQQRAEQRAARLARFSAPAAASSSAGSAAEKDFY